MPVKKPSSSVLSGKCLSINFTQSQFTKILPAFWKFLNWFESSLVETLLFGLPSIGKAGTMITSTVLFKMHFSKMAVKLFWGWISNAALGSWCLQMAQNPWGPSGNRPSGGPWWCCWLLRGIQPGAFLCPGLCFFAIWVERGVDFCLLNSIPSEHLKVILPPLPE